MDLSWMSLSMFLAGLAGWVVCLRAWTTARADGPGLDRLESAGAVFLGLVWLLMVPAAVLLWRQGVEAPWLFGAETYDGGVVETVTGLGLAASALLAANQAVRSSGWFRTAFWGGVAALAFLAFGEETSWGQHLFRWSATGVFATANLQAETNLHNFISPRLYDVAYALVGWGLIALAAVNTLRPGWIAFVHPGPTFRPSSRIGTVLLVSAGVLIQHEVFEEMAEAVVIAALVFYQARQGMADQANGPLLRFRPAFSRRG